MAADVTLTPRKIYIEDIDLTTVAAGDTASVNVLGAAGNPQTLNKVDILRFTQYGSYANDAAAATGGVPVGGHYYNSTNSAMHTRMS